MIPPPKDLSRESCSRWPEDDATLTRDCKRCAEDRREYRCAIRDDDGLCRGGKSQDREADGCGNHKGRAGQPGWADTSKGRVGVSNMQDMKDRVKR